MLSAEASSADERIEVPVFTVLLLESSHVPVGQDLPDKEDYGCPEIGGYADTAKMRWLSRCSIGLR